MANRCAGTKDREKFIQFVAIHESLLKMVNGSQYYRALESE